MNNTFTFVPVSNYILQLTVIGPTFPEIKWTFYKDM